MNVTPMHPIALIATDLDGTLLASNDTLSPQNILAIQRAARRGVRVILATTRNPDTVQSFCRTLEIADPVICTNGAQVWGSPDGPAWACHTIPRDVALEIAQWADDHDWELSITVGEMTYWRQRPGQALGLFAASITIVPSNADAIVGEPVRMSAHAPPVIEGISALCASKFAAQCHTETYYKPDGSLHALAIFAPGANKGVGLALVLERLGIAPEHVLALGDNLNDLALFDHAGVRVAMGNAVEALKRRATAIAPTNDDHGVAWAVERFVLGED